MNAKIEGSTHLCTRDYIRMWGEEWEPILQLVDETIGEGAVEVEEEEGEIEFEG